MGDYEPMAGVLLEREDAFTFADELRRRRLAICSSSPQDSDELRTAADFLEVEEALRAGLDESRAEGMTLLTMPVKELRWQIGTLAEYVEEPATDDRRRAIGKDIKESEAWAGRLIEAMSEAAERPERASDMAVEDRMKCPSCGADLAGEQAVDVLMAETFCYKARVDAESGDILYEAEKANVMSSTVTGLECSRCDERLPGEYYGEVVAE